MNRTSTQRARAHEKILRSAIQLRVYQHDNAEQIRQAYRENRRSVLYVLPTGGGKTYTFSYIAQGAAEKGRRILILVHRNELLDQCSSSLDNIGVRHGCISPHHTMTRSPVQIGSVQTVIRRLDKMIPPDLIIIDEAHHAVAGSWLKVIEAFPAAKVLGVTATPTRLDGRGLGQAYGGVFDSMVVGPTIRELIADGYLVPSKVFAPPNALDLVGVRKIAGDFNRKDLAQRVDKPTITGDAVAHYQKICPKTPAIAFCANIEHAKHVTEQFKQAGFKWALLVGQPHMSDFDRARVNIALRSGDLDGVATVDLVSEGYDVPTVGCAILLRPTQSTALYLQQVGRAMRPVPGKTKAIILDHVGNTIRHGLPDEDREWGLDGEHKRNKQDEEIAERHDRSCLRCYARHIWSLVCPECGFEYPGKKRDEIKQVAGELVEIDEIQADLLRAAKRKEVGQAKTFEELQSIEIARGYRKGWAYHVFKSRQGKRAA